MAHQQGVYKEDPAPVAGDPHHPHHIQQGPVQQLQHPRPSSIVHPQPHPNSPHQPVQPQHPGAFPSPHSSSHGLPLQQHQSPYTQSGPGPNGQPPPEVTYYHPSPYGTPASGQYSSSEPPDLMATAHMQRPYPPVYHTPQSNSPASVASSQSHDQHARMYGQPPQLAQQMPYYAQYPPPPVNQIHPSAYPQHPGPQPQHPNMTSQPGLLMSHQQGQPPLQHQQPQAQTPGMANSPRPKLEPSQQRPMDQAALQRPPSGPMVQNHNPNHNPPGGPPSNGSGLHQGPPGGGGVNPNAAPGPIPATTPLVVRQDNNGVQWIAFEYSRDRVKMEYTIRCDVESVNVDGLSADFKTENCVYPRACCQKDQYRGNRLVYETECNTVGWALAELNPCLRGKRGLIQRAVDSWRNSNQDPRLRSRRVRRMAKINNRKHVQASHPTHLAGPGGPGGGPGGPGSAAGVAPGANPMAAPAQRPQPSNISMGGPQLHHHHAHPDGSVPGSTEDVSVNGDYDAQRPQIAKAHPINPPGDVRQSQVFHGYPNFPSNPAVGTAIAPPLHDGMEGAMVGHGVSNPTAVAAAVPKTEDEERNTALFGDLPEAKRRKFILVDDPDRNSRVRVRVMLEHVDMNELPDAYRKANSVYPRSYFPIQMQSPPGKARGNRFFDDDDPEGGSKDDGVAVRGKTLVPVPMLDGNEGEVAVPKIGRSKRGKEILLNDLGYRMSWSQSRVFAGRTMFLQRALDAYRNKMRSTMTAGGQDVSAVAPHFDTRVGKRKFLERKRKTKREATPS